MSSEVSEAYETKQQEILLAAQGLFARYGLAKTTLDEVARAVGMKKASLYYYYKSKEALFCAATRLEIADLLSRLRQAVDDVQHAREQLLRFMQTRVAYVRSLVSLHGLAAQVILEVRPVIEDLYGDLRAQEEALLREIIEGGIARGEFRPCSADEVADAILTVVHSVELMAVQDASNRSRAEIDYDWVERKLTVILKLIGSGLEDTRS